MADSAVLLTAKALPRTLAAVRRLSTIDGLRCPFSGKTLTVYQLPGIATSTLSQRVEEQLREAILLGQLPPGQRLIEEQLAREFGVSRAPVREALQRLAHEGFVRVRPRHGYIVQPLTATMVEELFDLRLALEPPVFRTVAEAFTEELARELDEILQRMDGAASRRDWASLVQADAAFHAAIAVASRRPITAQLLRQLETLIARTVILLGSIYPDPQLLVQEHSHLLAVLASGKPERAEAAIRDHLLDARTKLLASFGETSPVVPTEVRREEGGRKDA